MAKPESTTVKGAPAGGRDAKAASAAKSGAASGATATATAEAAEEEKKPKIALPRELAVNAQGESLLDASGKLTGTPVKWDPRLHLPLAKEAFASPAEFYEFKAWQSEESAKRSLERATKLRQDADNFRRFGDPEKRAKVKRAQRLKEQLAALEKQLREEGIEDWSDASAQ